MQPIRTIWTTLVGDHPGIIPVKFGHNPMSGFRAEDVKVKKFTDDARRTTDDGQRPVTIAHHEHFVLRWAQKGLMKHTEQIFSFIHYYILADMNRIVKTLTWTHF